MDDLEFVQRCVKGDKPAWDDFVNRYSRLIYSCIHSALRIKPEKHANAENIKDIFQDIFVLLSKEDFRKLKTFKAKNSCSLASWLRQVVLNYTIDFLRRQRSLVSLDEEDEEGGNLGDILADCVAPLEDKLALEEKISQLKDCIDTLRLDEQFFLELHLRQGLSLDEIKDLLKLPRGTVDMRKARIIERLKDCFHKKGFALDF